MPNCNALRQAEVISLQGVVKDVRSDLGTSVWSAGSGCDGR